MRRPHGESDENITVPAAAPNAKVYPTQLPPGSSLTMTKQQKGDHVTLTELAMQQEAEDNCDNSNIGCGCCWYFYAFLNSIWWL